MSMPAAPALLPLMLMWLAMMLVMMAPAALPLAHAYGATLAERTGRARAGGIVALVCGYLGLWLLFALALVGAQVALTALGLFSYDGQLSSQVASGVLLTATGLYQITPWKEACLARCRSPAAYLALHWREGARGALRMGVSQGLHCVGCCWLLFAALFALGTMSFAWMAALIVIVLAERHPRLGPWMSWVVGLACAAYGLSLLI